MCVLACLGNWPSFLLEEFLLSLIHPSSGCHLSPSQPNHRERKRLREREMGGGVGEGNGLGLGLRRGGSVSQLG